ncbi:MAG TPA: metalloregulator ArsR/SmtB family transcription factor [Thermomicrobiaceae bacterium]|nr:metalloregulator ArsR/SmtB family transcription factor [Thermomicrobiaceae bacterium]
MARPRKRDQIREPEQLEACADPIVHLDAVQRSRARLPEAAAIAELSALFAAVGDPTRLRLVAALAGAELCVCDLAATCGLSQSAVSHHLRRLRELGLVRPRRDGRLVYYALDDAHVAALFDQGLDHVRHRLEGQMERGKTA